MPADIVSDIFRGLLTFVLKMQQNTAQVLDEIKIKLENTADTVQRLTTNVQHDGHTAEEVRAAAKEATEVEKATLELAREIRNKRPQEQASGPLSYAAAAARGTPLASTYNAQSLKAPSVQTQHEVMMNIRIQSLRAMNPRNLKAHMEHAVDQSGKEHIASVKIVSSNQLKSRDRSINSASSSEAEALRQFADIRARRIGTGRSQRTAF